MLTATYKKYVLRFKQPAGTSRGVISEKETWFLFLERDSKIAIGECGILRSLSYDDRPDYEQKLKWVCANISKGVDELWHELRDFPSIQFGLETAFRSLEAQSVFELFPSAFTHGQDSIKINGLIWMGEKEFMKHQIDEKLAAGFNCIKLKIGAIDFDKELELLAYIRSLYSRDVVEIRVDANGGFSAYEALSKIEQLAGFEIHSIEQPIAVNQHDSMSALCKSTPIPIVLDEELIGITDADQKQELLARIAPQYIILKPSLIGGFRGSQEWLDIAEQLNIGWWVTSALESNIGLNAIAQWTFALKNPMPQGLGTGGLYTNNIDSPLQVDGGRLHYRTDGRWQSFESIKNS